MYTDKVGSISLCLLPTYSMYVVKHSSPSKVDGDFLIFIMHVMTPVNANSTFYYQPTHYSPKISNYDHGQGCGLDRGLATPKTHLSLDPSMPTETKSVG